MPLYSIAGLSVFMEPQDEPLISRAQKYRIRGAQQAAGSDFSLIVTDSDRQRNEAAHPELSPGELEYLAFGHAFYDALTEYNGLMLHSSAVVYRNRAYLFSAPCGVGKSTHTGLWLSVLGPLAHILNDDKPALRIRNGIVYACGTPFSGKDDLSVNETVCTGGICFISRGEANSIARIKPADAVPLFIAQTICPQTAEGTARALSLAERIVSAVPVYRLACTPHECAARLAICAMADCADSTRP